MAGLSPTPIKTQASTPNLSNIASPAIEFSSATKTSSLPDTAVFNFLPDLYLLISRLSELRNPPSTANGTTSTTTNGTTIAGISQSQSQSLPPTQSDISTQHNSTGLTQTISRESAHSTSNSLRHVPSAEASIEVRDLPTHVYALRRKIEEAKEVVKGLPDVGRDIEEQEAEMEELKRQIGGLRGRLKELGGIASRGSTEDKVVGNDVVMEGVES